MGLGSWSNNNLLSTVYRLPSRTTASAQKLDDLILERRPLHDARTTILSKTFFCSEWTHLNLSNCILNPPSRFESFHNLKKVQLSGVMINADMSFGTGLDESLSLARCTGVEHLGRLFSNDNNLLRLMINDSEVICVDEFLMLLFLGKSITLVGSSH